MPAWACSASSAKTSISLSRIFKRISCGSPGMTGTGGIGDVYGRCRFLFDEPVGRKVFE